MGQVQSTPDPARAYNTDPKRLAVLNVLCCTNENNQTSAQASECGAEDSRPGVSPNVLLAADYNKATNSLVASRPEKRPLTFVQEPASGQMVLQVPYQPSLLFRFSLSIALIPGNEHHRLVFAHASSGENLYQIISNRQTGNWIQVGTWTEPRHPVIENLSFTFVWDAQADRIGGQPIHFAFFFDGPTPRLATGATVWVSERPHDELSLLYGPGSVPQQLQPPSIQKPSPITGSPPSSPRADATTQSATARPRGDDTMPYGMPLQSPALPMARRPGPEHLFLNEDGPHFRSALVSMERRVPSMRARTKQLIKRALITRERLEALIEADTWLASGVQEAANYEFPSLQPVTDWFSRNSEGGLSSIQRQRKVTLNELTTRIIEPLQRFYEYDIKGFEQRKREFEEESNQFYSWTSRYLANRKEGRRNRAGETADVKFGIKKRAFDVARFDYFSYLSDITIGLKKQVLLQLLTLATQSLTDSHIALGKEMSSRTQPRVDAVVEDIKKAARLWENYRLDNIQTRKRLAEDFANEAERAAISNIDRSGSPDNSKSWIATPIQPRNYKEGLLWASSRPEGHQESQTVPNKQSLQNLKWHKYWVVLDGGTLREYTNWKQSSVDLHNEPINLLVASVREARSSDRRFCFEVVTPQYKRVYQTTTEDDVRTWIAAINRSISTMLESGDEPLTSPIGRDEQVTSPTTVGAANIIHALSGASNNPNPNSGVVHSPPPTINTTMEGGSGGVHPKYYPVANSSSSGSTISRVNSRVVSRSEVDSNVASLNIDTQSESQGTGGADATPAHERPHIARINTSVNSPDKPIPVPLESPIPVGANASPEDLIRAVQRIPSNRFCGECNSTQNVEWVSINLLIVMCIECSGAHRSLGSHISKVRSLTLDTGAFTPSLDTALLSVSNEMINKIWEARIGPNRKISPDASGHARTKYVTEKYVEKQFIEELEKPNAVLRRAIREQNIPLLCAALASRANPNSVSDADEPVVIDALRSAGPLDSVFPAAEVLVKNGASVPPLSAYSGLSTHAYDYLAARQSTN